jgi:transcriptional regulator with XRE-family HTH domain
MNIKQLRVLRGLKQKELADMLGISAQQLNNYEGGSSNPGNKILPALADALGVSTAYLRGDAQRLAVYDWQTGRTEALPIVAETVIDDYGIFYLVEHPKIGMMAVIQSEGMQFTLADWTADQPLTVDAISGKQWVDSHGEDVIMYKGLPRILVGGEFGSKRDRII